MKRFAGAQRTSLLGGGVPAPLGHGGLLDPCVPLSSLRDIEYKELQLSLDQVSTSKSQDSWRTALSTSQETRKLARPKSTKMKTKPRTNPYPPQVTHASCRGGARPTPGSGGSGHLGT